MAAFCRLCLNFCFQSYNASRLEPVQLMGDTKALGLLTSRLASNPNLLSLEYHFRCVDRLTRPHHPVTHLAGANVAAAPASLRNKMALGTRPQFFRAVNRRGHLLQPLCGRTGPMRPRHWRSSKSLTDRRLIPAVQLGFPKAVVRIRLDRADLNRSFAARQLHVSHTGRTDFRCLRRS
jgi:hypothetical protein